MRVNALRLLAAAPLVLDPPPEARNATFAYANAFVADASSGLIAVDTDVNDPWANENGAYGLLFVSTPQNASLRTYHGSYRLRVVREGDPISTPSSLSYFAPGEIAEGQRIFTRCVALEAAGNVSREIKSSIVVQA